MTEKENKIRTKEQFIADFNNCINPFPVSAEEVEWVEELMKDFPPVTESDLPDVLKSAWSCIVHGYLKSNVRKGIREFRIAMQDDKRFIIHPLNANGETLDWSL